MESLCASNSDSISSWRDKDEKLYEPAERGFEKNILQYLNWAKGEKSP